MKFRIFKKKKTELIDGVNTIDTVKTVRVGNFVEFNKMANKQNPSLYIHHGRVY